MKYTIKDMIRSLDMADWCMVALIIVLHITAYWYAYYYDIPDLLTGVAIGIPIGALAMGLGMSARDHKAEAEREREG